MLFYGFLFVILMFFLVIYYFNEVRLIFDRDLNERENVGWIVLRGNCKSGFVVVFVVIIRLVLFLVFYLIVFLILVF